MGPSSDIRRSTVMRLSSVLFYFIFLVTFTTAKVHLIDQREERLEVIHLLDNSTEFDNDVLENQTKPIRAYEVTYAGVSTRLLPIKAENTTKNIEDINDEKGEEKVEKIEEKLEEGKEKVEETQREDRGNDVNRKRPNVRVTSPSRQQFRNPFLRLFELFGQPYPYDDEERPRPIRPDRRQSTYVNPFDTILNLPLFSSVREELTDSLLNDDEVRDTDRHRNAQRYTRLPEKVIRRPAERDYRNPFNDILNFAIDDASVDDYYDGVEEIEKDLEKVIPPIFNLFKFLGGPDERRHPEQKRRRKELNIGTDRTVDVLGMPVGRRNALNISPFDGFSGEEEFYDYPNLNDDDTNWGFVDDLAKLFRSSERQLRNDQQQKHE